jgi:hypothetical protein
VSVRNQSIVLQSARHFTLDDNSKKISKTFLPHEKPTCQVEPTKPYSSHEESTHGRVNEMKQPQRRLHYDLRYLQHLWPLDSLRCHIQKSIIQLAYAMLKEAMGRKLYLQIHGKVSSFFIEKSAL